MQSVKVLQGYLNDLGANLDVDGIFGALTTGAIEELDFPKHVEYALKEVGTKEIKGSRNNPRVLEYHKTTAGQYSSDEVPWCGSFVNWCFWKSGNRDTVSYPERASSWANFGAKVGHPFVGAIAVKKRKGGGHVCIVVGADSGGRILCVGGNQNDEVDLKAYNVDDFYALRMPFGVTFDYIDVDIDEIDRVKES